MEQEHQEVNTSEQKENVPETQTETVEQKQAEQPATASKNGIMIVVGALVVVVLAFVYLWGAGIDINDATVETPDEPLPIVPVSDEGTEDVRELSTSDAVEALEQDLENTDLENLDGDLEALEAELDALLSE